ncbi:MAG: hypothetical protein IJ068_06765 [Bacilli bacterium]|nr:hypothetical protein [Bacilli bacterium]
MKIGDYVRYKHLNITRIAKIVGIIEPEYEGEEKYFNFDDDMGANESDIIAYHEDIERLIYFNDVLYIYDKDFGKYYKGEVQYVNGLKRIINYLGDDYLNLEYEIISEEHIIVAGILTHEEYEDRMYKIFKKEKEE